MATNYMFPYTATVAGDVARHGGFGRARLAKDGKTIHSSLSLLPIGRVNGETFTYFYGLLKHTSSPVADGYVYVNKGLLRFGFAYSDVCTTTQVALGATIILDAIKLGSK